MTPEQEERWVTEIAEELIEFGHSDEDAYRIAWERLEAARERAEDLEFQKFYGK